MCSADEATELQLVDDFKHLLDSESSLRLNTRINLLVVAGWELRYVRRIEREQGQVLWHAMLHRRLPHLSATDSGQASPSLSALLS